MPQQQAYDLKDVDLHAHPAFLAWRAVRPLSGHMPQNIAVLQEKSRAGVYRLDGVGPAGESVIAEHSKRVKNIVEWRIYREILPDLPVTSVRCYDLLEAQEDMTSSWIFLSVAEGDLYSTFNPQHRILAAKWLALLHTRTADAAAKVALPDRSDEYYLGLLRSARSTMRENFDNPALNDQQQAMLTQCIAECDRVESHWDQVERICAHSPWTLIHGDFASKNMRVSNNETGPVLIPFDWGQAGFGVPAADLAQPQQPEDRYWTSPDLETYRNAIRGHWPDLELEHLRALAHVGRIFRALVCLNGDVKSLRTPWVEREVYKIDAYRQQIEDTVRDLGWRGRGLRGTRGGRDRGAPDYATLEGGLTHMFRSEGTCQSVVVTKRELNLYASTFYSELVTCRLLPGDRDVELLCKYFDGDIDTSWGHRGNASYEAHVYRRILGRINLGTPRFYGSFVEQKVDRTWLAIERVSACERLDEMATDVVAESLCAAAAWIGVFHTATAAWRDFDPLLIRHDPGYYLSWAGRMLLFSRRTRERYPWVEDLCRHAEALLAPLLEDKPTVIHGEFYPHNLLVRDGRIIPIDWQSAAVAPGAIDLAALTENWPPEIVKAAEQAYRSARWPHGGVPSEFPRVLQAARLHLHFRWLGDRPKWTSAQRSRWRFEELRLAGERAGLI